MRVAKILILVVISISGQAQTEQEYYAKGVTKLEALDYKGAIVEFSKAIEINPSYKMAYADRAFSKARILDYRGAISDFTKLIELAPEAGRPYIERGIVKDRLYDYRGAIADFNKALELNLSSEDLPKVYAARGGSKFELLDYQGAIADFSKTIELRPSDADGYYNRGIAKLRLKSKDSGCLDLSKAGELGHDEAYDAIRDLCN